MVLGNDAIFLSQNDDGEIIAWLSPGRVNIHPNSIPLLKQSDHILDQYPIGPDGKYHLSPTELINSKLNKVPVNTLIFPHIAPDNTFDHHVIAQSIALTKLMEQSIDNWDEDFLGKHFSFLQALIKQANSFSISLSTNMSQFSQQMAAILQKA